MSENDQSKFVSFLLFIICLIVLILIIYTYYTGSTHYYIYLQRKHDQKLNEVITKIREMCQK